MDAVILKYSVAKVSSEDDEYSTSELLSPGPSCKGWVTDKYCVYPQVIYFHQNYTLNFEDGRMPMYTTKKYFRHYKIVIPMIR